MKITKPLFVQSDKMLCNKLSKQLSGRRFVLLTDELVSAHCFPHLADFLADFSPLDIIEVEPGEASKAPEVVMQLWSHLIDLGFTKSDVLVCVGGGSITDLGGFVAATYKRGVPTIFIPTTLLAMTDAAIGGKNGVDFEDIKNAIGTIMQPEAVLVFPPFCESLSMQQVKSGAAEVLKHAIIQGGDFWNCMEVIDNLTACTSMDILKLSTSVKMKIVANDERETGLRKILNFGHTIGHAVESAAMNAGRPIEHGIAVAFGMHVETVCAFSIGMLNQHDYLKIVKRIITLFGGDFSNMPQWSEAERFIVHDKKSGSQGIAMYLPVKLGDFRPAVISRLDQLEEAYNRCLG